jgi:hypothetical protein
MTTPPPPEPSDNNRIARWLLSIGGLVALVTSIVMTGTASTATDTAVSERGQKESAQQQVQVVQRSNAELRDRAIALCTGADAEGLAQLNAVGLCNAAATMDPTPVPAPNVPFSVVKQAVEAYFAANPVKDGESPTPEQLLEYVNQVYRANPPKDAPPPTDEYLLGLIRQVYAANPPTPAKDGVDGKDAYCFTNPDDTRCQPKDGKTGAQGIGVQGMRFQLADDNQCSLIVDLFNPADGSTEKANVPVPRGLCEDPPPAASVTEIPTTTPS